MVAKGVWSAIVAAHLRMHIELRRVNFILPETARLFQLLLVQKDKQARKRNMQWYGSECKDDIYNEITEF